MASKLNYVVSYAQNREDIILEGFFPDIKDGFYVDVGAFDPTVDSVTNLFYLKGWTGINIEPIESRYRLFVNDRPRDINLNVGISSKKGNLELVEYVGEGLSTFSEKIQKQYIDSPSPYNEIKTKTTVPVETLSSIFSKYTVEHISFLKIDVEGFEKEVLEGNDWLKYRPEIICIEANHIIEDWQYILRDASYTKVFNDGLNDYYVAKESYARAKKFSYPDTVFWPPVANLYFHNLIKNLEERNTELEFDILDTEASYKYENNQLIAQINALHQKHQSTRVRHLVKALLLKLDWVVNHYISRLEIVDIEKPTYFSQDLSVGELTNDSEQALLFNIRLLDLSNYYNKSPVAKKKFHLRNFLYWITFFTYKFIRLALREFVILLFKLVKAMKGKRI